MPHAKQPLGGGSVINPTGTASAPNQIDSRRLSNYAGSFLAAFSAHEESGRDTIKAIAVIINRAETYDDLAQIQAALGTMLAVLRRPMAEADAWVRGGTA